MDVVVLSITVPDEVAQELERIGKARGVRPDSVAAEVLSEALRRRRLANQDLGALLDDLARQRGASELTEDEVMELAISEQRAWRAEQKARDPQDRR